MELIERAESFVNHCKISEAIAFVEAEMRKITETPYHVVLGRDLLHMSGDITDWLQLFHSKAEVHFQVGAIYSEMNGFSINPDQWFVDAFAYQTLGPRNDWDWLSDWDFDIPDSELTLTGFEELQSVYQRWHSEEECPANMGIASDIADLLVVLRLQQVFQDVWRKNDLKKVAVSRVPLLVTAHDWDMIAAFTTFQYPIE